LSRPRNKVKNAADLSVQLRKRVNSSDAPEPVPASPPDEPGGLKSRLDFSLELKAGYRYLHVREIVEQNGLIKRVRCSRDLIHAFHRDDFSEGDWEALSKGACISVRIRDWKVSEINVIGSG
jgi:hypothetical protein